MLKCRSTISKLLLVIGTSFALATTASVERAQAQWGGWESLGGVILEEPNCVSWGANRIDCFARGTDRAMWHRWWNGSAWGGWESLGGVILEEPNCVSWGANRIDCFARGTDRAMWHRWWNGSAWGGWESLGGIILEQPNCVSWGANRIDCFARGTDRAMWHRWWNGSAWGGWESLGGIILEQPNCVSWGANRIDCFARGTDRAMWHRWWNGSAWGGWESLGGIILEQPDCVSWGANRIDCFARGTDRAMWHRWWNGSAWGGWESLGGVILEQPNCVSWGANRIDCFARGTDAAMWHRWWNGSAWGGWESLGGVILEQPNCVSWGADRIDCFARGTDRAMWHRWWPCPSCGLVSHNLQVSRFTTAAMTDPDVDRIFADASTILQVNDGPGDVACPVGFTRSGTVTTFSTGDGSIDSATEFNSVIGLPGWVKVVNQINWCGSLAPNIIGCSPVPGNSLSVVPFTPALEGALFVHEFGHDKGLNHRNDDANAVMNGVIGPTRRRINAAECTAYQNTVGGVVAAVGVMPADSDSGAEVMIANSGTMPEGGAGTASGGTSEAMPQGGEMTGQARGGTMPGSNNATMPEEGAGTVSGGTSEAMPQGGEITGQARGETMPGSNNATMPEGGAGTASGGTNGAMPQGGEITGQARGGTMSGSKNATMPEDSDNAMPDAGDPGAPAADIRDFVRQIFVEGVPYEEAVKFDASNVPTLVEMLRNPEEKSYWANIVVVLGMIGGEQGINPLINFIEDDSITMTRDTYAAKTSAIMSLGYVLNQTGSQRVLDYLVNGLRPTNWTERNAEGIAPFQASIAERNVDFGKHAILGLALSGRPEAAAALQSLQRPSAAASPEERTFQAQVSDLISDSLAENS